MWLNFSGIDSAFCFCCLILFLFVCLFVCLCFFFMRLYFVEHNETLKCNFNWKWFPGSVGKTKRVLVAFMYLFVLLMIYIKSEFSIFMYIYFKNFVWLFLVSAYISQGWFGWKISLKGNLSFIKFYLKLFNLLITQLINNTNLPLRAKARHNALISYGNFAPVDTCTCKS